MDVSSQQLVAHACTICAQPRPVLAYACKKCKKALDRLDLRAKFNRQARLAALKKSWDGQCFRCYYTG